MRSCFPSMEAALTPHLLSPLWPWQGGRGWVKFYCSLIQGTSSLLVKNSFLCSYMFWSKTKRYATYLTIKLNYWKPRIKQVTYEHLHMIYRCKFRGAEDYSNVGDHKKIILVGSGRCYLSVLITKPSSFLLQSSVSAVQKEEGKSGQVCPALPSCLSAQMPG